MLHQTILFLGQLWQLFEVSQILEFLRYVALLLLVMATSLDGFILLRTDENSLAMLAHAKAKFFTVGERGDRISYTQTASRWANVVFSLKKQLEICS